VAQTGTIGCAKARHHDAAMTSELAIEVAFGLTVSGIDAPVQYPYMWAQIVDMPMASHGAVEMAVQARHQPASGAASVGVIPAWEVLIPQASDSD
jgi:hypothetical protein